MKLIFKRRDDLQNGVYKVGWLNPTLTLRTLTRRWKTILFCARPHPFYGGNWTGIHLEFPIHFKDIGHMASFTKKCDDHETSSFCVAFGSFGFFLTSTFLPVKHHQPCTLLQSASQLQLSIGCLWENETSKNCWFVYWSRGLFLWMVQRKSRFRNLKRVDGTTQEFVSCALRVCNFQSRLL